MNAYLTRDKLDPIYDGSGKLDDDYKYPCMGLWLVRSSGLLGVAMKIQLIFQKILIIR